MGRSGFSALLEDLTGPLAGEGKEEPGKGAAKAGAGEATDQDTEGWASPAHGGTPAPGTGEPPGGPPAELYPANLELTRAEVDFMSRLHGLIGTPRGLKRFVNTYRLLRISVPPGEWAAFRDPERGEHRHAILLLALLVGHAHEAGLLFQGLLERQGPESWGAFVADLAPHAAPQSDVGNAAQGMRYRNGVASLIPLAEVPRWRRIHAALAAVEPLAAEPLVPFRKWAERVARYAFYPIRMPASDARP
jgi:hypothetical protein